MKPRIKNIPSQFTDSDTASFSGSKPPIRKEIAIYTKYTSNFDGSSGSNCCPDAQMHILSVHCFGGFEP